MAAYHESGLGGFSQTFQTCWDSNQHSRRLVPYLPFPHKPPISRYIKLPSSVPRLILVYNLISLPNPLSVT